MASVLQTGAVDVVCAGREGPPHHSTHARPSSSSLTVTAERGEHCGEQKETKWKLQSRLDVFLLCCPPAKFFSPRACFCDQSFPFSSELLCLCVCPVFKEVVLLL